MGSDGNEAPAVGAVQGTRLDQAATVLVDLPEWATAEDVAVAWPALGDEQIDAFGRFGEERPFGTGEILYRQEDSNFAMYVVLQGRVRIIEDYGGAQEHPTVEYGPRGFVGEYNLLTRTTGPAINVGAPIDRRDVYRMVLRVVKVAGIPRHISP